MQFLLQLKISHIQKKFFSRLILCLIALGAFFPAIAQDGSFTFSFGGKVTEFNEKKGKDVPVEACSVTLHKGGSIVQTQNTGSNGKFKFKLEQNGEYEVRVTKTGYITKKFTINTFNVPPDRTQFPFADFDVEIELFKIFPGLDYSVLNKPIAKIIYNPAKDVDDFDYDKVYTAQMQAELEKLKELARQAREKQKLYNAAIERADKAFAAKDWNGAKSAYNEALGIIPTEQYPKDQIALCDKNLGLDAAAAAAEKKYKDALAEADKLFAAKNWSAAKAKYQEASGMKPNEQYPKDKIAECDKNIAADAAAAANEQKYKDAIAAADAKFAAKDWAGAKAKYQEALGLKPAEKYPKDKIAECDKNIAAEASAAANEQKYKDAIADADKKFAAKDWNGAKAKYQEASGLKPAEQYPKDKIAECDKNISADAAAAAKQKQYDDAIKAADEKFFAKDWNGAKAKYQEASGIKPDEKYPKDRIAECDKNIAADASAAAKQKSYDDAIKAADAKFTAKDWVGAKAEYQKASGIKPEEQYPKDRIKACDDNIAADKLAADKAAKDKQYSDAIAAADAKFNEKDWAGAKAEYQKASGIKPDEKYPKDRIAECDKNIADDKAAADLEKNYKDKIAKADAALKAKDYNNARSLYSEASGLKPAEQYPKDKIAEIDKILADKAAADALSQQYNAVIKDADAKFTAKDWAGAKAKYQEASALKPAEQYPKDKIKACDDNIAKDAAAAANEQKYKEAIADADAKFAAKDWNAAKAKYQEASALKPAEKYPKDKIAECDKNIAADASAAAKEKQYQDAIAAADAKFNGSDWGGAKAEYQKASGIKPDEKYPKDRIAECDKKIGEMKAADLDKKYKDAIAAADEKFNAKDWAGAKSKYSEASGLKPAEQYPKDRIAECDKNIAADKALADAEKKYAAAIAKADAAFKAKDYTTAKASYTEASGLKPDEKYPKDKIAEIDALLADKAATDALNKEYNDLIKQADAKFTAKDWTGARGLYEQAAAKKPAEQYPKDRIKACDDKIAAEMNAAELDKKYKAAIARADSAFNAKDYETAQTAYTNASGIKPAEQYPKTRLAEISKILAGMQKERENQAKYNAAIAKGDSLLALKEYNAAKGQYSTASAIKPAEKYPKDKIAEIDKILAAMQAGADRDKKYADAVARGDKAFGLKDYTAAKSAFTEANSLKPDEQYPKDKLAEIEKLLAEKASADALNKKYADLIKQADAKFTAKSWEEAKSLYQQALDVKPEEQYPKDRIKACDENILKSASAAEIDKKYKDALAKADALFAAKDYTGARAVYVEASEIKPVEVYPKNKIAECDKFIAADKANSERDKAYLSELAKADSLFKLKEYANAKKEYQTASSKKPNEQYPKDKMAECDRAIADQKFEEQKTKKYNDLIAKADKQFAAKDWKGAKATYQEALKEKPLELYPKQKIAECDKQLNPQPVNTNPVSTEPKAGSDEYINDLVKKYPQGKTVEEQKEGNVTTVKCVVIIGNKGWIYTQKVYSWGTFYFKDGAQISEQTYRYETSPQYIQQQQAEYDKNKGK